MSKEKKQLRIPSPRVDEFYCNVEISDIQRIYCSDVYGNNCCENTCCDKCMFSPRNIEEFKEWFNKVEFR